MKQNFPTRRHLLTAGSVLLSAPAWAKAPLSSPEPNLRPVDFLRPPPKTVRAFEDIIKNAGVSGEHSIALMDLQTGEITESHNAKAILPPASVMKVPTALYALSQLGMTKRFTTELLISGPIVKGVVQGDLILRGGGDPHLDTDGLGELFAQLAARGVKGVTGKFLIDQSALPFIDQIDKSQPKHVGYNPSISGLNLNFNRVFFLWAKRGADYRLSMTARATNLRPEISGIKVSTVARDLPIYDYAPVGRFGRWTVARGAMGNSGSRWLPVRRVLAYVGEVAQIVAKQNGTTLPLAVEGKAPDDAVLVAAIQSAQLRFMLRAMLRFSTNLTAEVSGLAASQAIAPVASLGQSGARMLDWARDVYGLSMNTRFVDHSGLGDDSRISASEMLKILQGDGWYGPLRPLLKDVKIKQDELHAPVPEGSKVVAKTGTLNFTSALAGYLEGANGKQYAFAIFSADLNARSKIPVHKREKPDGGSRWVKAAKKMQSDLLQRWTAEYGKTS